MNSATNMHVDKYMEIMSKIQEEFLMLINTEGTNKLTSDELILKFNQLKVVDNHDVFRSFLHLQSKIYENHHQFKELVKIIENIILYYKKDILENFQNCDIFSIFKNDKKILLFLLNSEILKLDKFLIQNLLKDKYSTFFYPEIKDYLEKDKKDTIEAKIPDNFIQKRQIGENDSILCEIIRNDLVDQFVSYISRTNCPLTGIINQSIFETNNFLIDKSPSLIEYSTFYGSIQIFQYLQSKDVQLTESIWYYAIHNNNDEIIGILEDNNIKPNLNKMAKKLLEESILCHHNEMANYINENYIENKDKVEAYYCFKSYNFAYIEMNYINRSNLINLCSFDYTLFVRNLIDKISANDLNKKEINISIRNNHYYSTFEYTALSEAVSNNNSEIVEILLSNPNIDVNYEYKTIDKLSFENNDFFVTLLVFDLISFVLMLFSSYFVALNISLITFTILGFLSDIKDFMYYPISLHTIMNLISLTPQNCEYLKQKSTVLHSACLLNNSKIVKILLSKSNIDVNAICLFSPYGTKENTALTIALNRNNDEIVKCLLSNPNIDANIEYKNKTPRALNKQFVLVTLILSIVANKFALLVLFIMYSCANFQTWRSFIKFLVTRFTLIVISLLLFKSMFPNTAKLLNIGSISRFFHFIEYLCMIVAFSELVSTLLYFSYQKSSPLFLAVENNNVECVKLLLENKNIDVNSFNKSGNYIFKDIHCSDYSLDLYDELYEDQTALYLAVENNNNEIVKLLLSKNGIDINAKCKKSNYKKIVFCSFISIFLYVIESAICLMFATRSKKSSIDVAVENKNSEIEKMLLEYNQKKKTQKTIPDAEKFN